MLLMFTVTFVVMITGIIYPHFRVWRSFYLNFASSEVSSVFKDLMKNPESWSLYETEHSIEVTKKDAAIKISKKRMDIGIYNYYVRTNLLESNLIKNAINLKKQNLKKKIIKEHNEVK